MRVKHIGGWFIDGFTVTLEIDGKRCIKRRVYHTTSDGNYVVIKGERVREDVIIPKYRQKGEK